MFRIFVDGIGWVRVVVLVMFSGYEVFDEVVVV